MCEPVNRFAVTYAYMAVTESKPIARRAFRILPTLAKSAAAALILTVTFSAGIMASPAFASYMMDVPGFNIAVGWLTQLRQADGVQQAIDHKYVPIEPVTAQFGHTKITIGDIYLTDEELIFKAYYDTDKFDVAARDPRDFFRSFP